MMKREQFYQINRINYWLILIILNPKLKKITWE